LEGLKGKDKNMKTYMWVFWKYDHFKRKSGTLLIGYRILRFLSYDFERPFEEEFGIFMRRN